MRRPPKQRVTKEQLSLKTGDLVNVTLDDGSMKRASVQSAPWQLGHGDWVVKLSGISGGYDLERCQKINMELAANQ